MTHTYKITGIAALAIAALTLLLVANVAAAEEVVTTAEGASSDPTLVTPSVDAAPTGNKPMQRVRAYDSKQRADWKTKKEAVKQDRRQLIDKAKEVRTEGRVKAKEVRTDLRERYEAADTPEERAAIKAEAKEKRTKAKEVRTEAKKKLAGAAKDRFTKHMKKTLDRLASVYKKLVAVNDRLQGYLDKLDADGVDTSEARASLAIAKDKTAEAKSLINSLGEKARETLADDANVREHIRAIRILVKEAIASVKEARKAIKETIRIVKSLK